MKILLRGGNVYTGNRFTASDILIDGGRIVSIADNIDNISVDKVISCDSFFICPGFIDVHVHLREPGFSYKGTVKTETEAAAAGMTLSRAAALIIACLISASSCTPLPSSEKEATLPAISSIAERLPLPLCSFVIVP